MVEAETEKSFVIKQYEEEESDKTVGRITMR
jgi:hypothetical protein